MSEPTSSTRHERRDIPATAVAAALAGLLLAVAVIAWVVALYQRLLPGHLPPPPQEISADALANLEDSRHWAIPDEGRRLEQELEARLGGFGWLDRERGVVFIPVERAAELALEDGLSVRTREAAP